MTMRDMGSGILLVVLLSAAGPMGVGLAAGHRAAIEFSDGEVREGLVSTTEGKPLRIHTAEGIRTLPLDDTAVLRWVPEKEGMARAWRFLEAGKTKKEETGDPYPVREVRTEAILRSGETVRGHLYTTVLYLEVGEQTEKVVLLAKQRGSEGTLLQDLVYPVSLTLAEIDGGREREIAVSWKTPGGMEEAELSALTSPSLIRCPVRRLAGAGLYSVPAPLGEQLFWGVRAGDRCHVGWPPPSDTNLEDSVQQALGSVKDFFDGRAMLGVHAGENGTDVFSLMRLWREGSTTLGGEKNRPWRVEIWRWKQDPDHGRMMLAGRGCLFRGIGKPGEVPEVRADAGLWKYEVGKGPVELSISD